MSVEPMEHGPFRALDFMPLFMRMRIEWMRRGNEEALRYMASTYVYYSQGRVDRMQIVEYYGINLLPLSEDFDWTADERDYYRFIVEERGNYGLAN